MRVAIIPARGGSKRIPRKNIRDFCGKPMIAYSIEAALISDCFDRVIVSTDSASIQDIALNYGAEVPFLRPRELSDDFATTRSVIAHAVVTLEIEEAQVCCIYATAPFVQIKDIQTAQRRLSKGDVSYVFPITSYAFPIQRALKCDQETGHIQMLNPDLFNTRSQDLEEVWHDAGQFYWAEGRQWLKDEPIFASSSVGISIPRYRVQDIDTPEDWQQAEYMFQDSRKGK